MEYFAAMRSPNDEPVEQQPELTEAQQVTREKVELLREDPNAERRDHVSAEAAAHFNDRANATEVSNDSPSQESQGTVGKEEETESSATRDKPEPQLKPEHAKGQSADYADLDLDAGPQDLSDYEAGILAALDRMDQQMGINPEQSQQRDQDQGMTLDR